MQHVPDVPLTDSVAPAALDAFKKANTATTRYYQKPSQHRCYRRNTNTSGTYT